MAATAAMMGHLSSPPASGQCQLGDFLKYLGDQSPLFAGLGKLGKNSTVAKAMAWTFTYGMGSPIIRKAEVGKEVLLPSGSPASETLALRSNPLFVVLEGNVEVHRDQRSRADGIAVTVPMITFGPGSTFGEFELRLGRGSTEWGPYTAEATAGWRSVVPWSKFTNRSIIQNVTGKFPTQQEASQCHLVLYRSFQHLGFSYDTKLLVLPQPTVQLLLANSSFALNFSELLLDHFRKFMAQTTCDAGQPLTHTNIHKHFIDFILPDCESANLPVLVPCFCIPELRAWWQKLNLELWNARQLSGRNPPYVFYMPVMLDRVGDQDALQLLKTHCPWPVLSREMVRAYARDHAMTSSRITPAVVKAFTDQVAGGAYEFKAVPDLSTDGREAILKAAIPELGDAALTEFCKDKKNMPKLTHTLFWFRRSE